MKTEEHLWLPYSEETEMALLGGLLSEEADPNAVFNILKPEDFYITKHRIIYEAIIELVENGKTLSPLVLINYLESIGKLQQVGGKEYIYLIAQEGAPYNTLEILAQQLKEKAIARNLILVAKNIIEKTKTVKDINQLIEEAETEIFRLNEERAITHYYDIKDVLKETLKIINELSRKETLITGIPSGFYGIDKLTTGFHPGDFIIIAARPAMGKTSFALSIIHNVSVVDGKPAVFFSLEMSKEQIAMRLLSLQTGIRLKDIRSGFLSQDKLEKITETARELSNAPIYIDDTPSLSILDLRAKARRLKRERDIQLIVVDYLQLMRSHRRTENRQQEVAEISRGLKALAKELNIPVISLAQLSRQAEMRADKRPQLADLRESGCLTGDTLVIDWETGKEVPIKDMVGKQFYTVSLGEDLKLRKAFVSKVFYSGRKKVYLIKTRTGREIKASANHPFLKLDGWHRLDNLKIGDRIAVPRILPKAEVNWNNNITQLYRLSNSDILWDEIVSIEELGVEDVYDMTVEETHNFVANGIIVHNSIEQDADLVMFIHRPEYYKKSPTPEEEGKAEIIIAKQRNGPTGTVELAFIKDITKFENIAKTSVDPDSIKTEDEIGDKIDEEINIDTIDLSLDEESGIDF
ncbi:MAG: replicative DNA helicase [Aquificae bacterium]|nr:replicative DNA helicase [Aquificota bacterium]